MATLLVMHNGDMYFKARKNSKPVLLPRQQAPKPGRPIIKPKGRT